jgi:hypothetical protein
MKTLDFEQMENLQGGKFHYSWQQHVGCALAGVVAGGGILGVAGYASCLLLFY